MEHKLIPFDLKKALAGDPVVNRRGDNVINIAYLPKAGPAERVVFICESRESVVTAYENGAIFKNMESGGDLFMKVKEVEYIIVTAKKSDGKIMCSSAYNIETEQDEYNAILISWERTPYLSEAQIHKIVCFEK